MLRLLFIAVIIGLGMRILRDLFGPPKSGAGRAGRPTPRRRRGARAPRGPGQGPQVKDVPPADYHWDKNGGSDG